MSTMGFRDAGANSTLHRDGQGHGYGYRYGDHHDGVRTRVVHSHVNAEENADVGGDSGGDAAIALSLVGAQAAPSEGIDPTSMDLAIAAWLHAKHGRSGSNETLAAYAGAMRGFRAWLGTYGLDVDAADPRRIRADLARSATDHGTAETLRDTPPEGAAIPAIPAAQVEEVAAERAATLAVLAQAYAAQPGTHGGARVRGMRGASGLETGAATDAAADPETETSTAQRPQHPAAPATVNRRLAALSSFYGYALRQGLLRGENPLARVERRRVEGYAGAVPLDYEDLSARLGHIDATTPAGARDYALLLLGLHTGRRLAELADMRREHVTIRPGHVDLIWPRCKGGTRAQARLPLRGAQGTAARALVTWLNLLYGEDGRLDPLLSPERLPARRRESPVAPGSDSAGSGAAGSGRPLWISLARNGTFGHPLSSSAVADICAARLGTSKVHVLRHTHARGLEDAGAKVSQIQAYLGHADLGTTGRYLARLAPEENPYLQHLADLFLRTRADTGSPTDSPHSPVLATSPASAAPGVQATPRMPAPPVVGSELDQQIELTGDQGGQAKPADAD